VTAMAASDDPRRKARRIPLTAEAVEHIEPDAARREIPVGEIRGLYLVVQPTGAKSYAMRYRVRGKPCKLTLGPAQMGLDEARKLAAHALVAIAAKRLPSRLKPHFASKVQTRAKLTNNSLKIVDGRSSEARRYRDLVRAYSAPLGSLGTLGAVDTTLVREAASMTILSEAMAASLVRGEAVDTEQSTRAANALSRLLRQLERRELALKHSRAAP